MSHGEADEVEGAGDEDGAVGQGEDGRVAIVGDPKNHATREILGRIQRSAEPAPSGTGSGTPDPREEDDRSS